MRVALDESGMGDPDELRLPQGFDILGAAVAHTGPQTADQLIDDLRHGALVRDLGDDAFRHKFLDIGFHVLEIPVLGTVLHGLDGAHATVGLELTAAQDDGLARGLLRPGEERASHDGAGTGGQRLGNVARIPDAAIGDDRHTAALEGFRRHHDGRQLRHAHAGDDTGGADGAGADADLDGVNARIREGLRTFGRGYVTGNDLDIFLSESLASLGDDIQDTGGMAVGRIDDHCVGTGRLQHFDPLDGIGFHTDRRCDEQPAAGVLAGNRVVLDLHQVLVGDQTDQAVVFIHDRKFLDLAAHQDVGGLRQADTLAGGDQVVGRHHIGNRTAVVDMEPQVAVGHDADQVALGVHHRDAANVVLGHHGEGIADGRFRSDGHGIVDHAVFRTLDTANLLALGLNGHVLVNHANATGTGHGDGQFRFGDGVHRGRDDRGVDGDVTGEMGRDIHVTRKDFRMGGYE